MYLVCAFLIKLTKIDDIYLVLGLDKSKVRPMKDTTDGREPSTGMSQCGLVSAPGIAS
jgi:hypothetical protein